MTTRRSTVRPALRRLFENVRSFGNSHQESRKLGRADKEQNAAEAKRAIEAKKPTDSYNEAQKVDKHEKVSQQHWRQADDVHDVAEAKKT